MRKLIGFFFLTLAAAAQGVGAPVEELNPQLSPISVDSSPAPANQAVIDLHYEMQALRSEVRQLRGIVEEQSNELRKLKQRQLDDYQDIDRRIGVRVEKNVSQPVSTGNSGSEEIPTMPTPVVLPAIADQGEKKVYTASYNLLKERKVDEAVTGFNDVVGRYPNGKYTANAYYWLGEIHLLRNNLEGAESAFRNVSSSFPAHRKALDAQFKLAKVYHLQGKNSQAKTLLEKVASANSSVASLAKSYLNENF